jgi:transcriptional regulator with XRE-family HTH domain
MERKVAQEYIDESLGFPVTLLDVPMKKVRGEWLPDLPLNEFQQVVLWMLAHMPVALSGKQVRFVRHWMEKTQQEFAEMLDVTHAAVSKWESKGHEPTGMAKPTEVLVRLNILTDLPDEIWQRLAAPYAAEDKPTSLKRLLNEIGSFELGSPNGDHLTVPFNDLPRPGRLPLR